MSTPYGGFARFGQASHTRPLKKARGRVVEVTEDEDGCQTATILKDGVDEEPISANVDPGTKLPIGIRAAGEGEMVPMEKEGEAGAWSVTAPATTPNASYGWVIWEIANVQDWTPRQVFLRDVVGTVVDAYCSVNGEDHAAAEDTVVRFYVDDSFVGGITPGPTPGHPGPAVPVGFDFTGNSSLWPEIVDAPAAVPMLVYARYLLRAADPEE